MEMQIARDKSCYRSYSAERVYKDSRIQGRETFQEKMYASLLVPGIRLIRESLVHYEIIRRSSFSFTME
jgi:hypothetical protein